MATDESQLPATEALNDNGEPSALSSALAEFILAAHELAGGVRGVLVRLHRQRVATDAELMALDAVLIDLSNLADDYKALATEFEDQSHETKEQA